VDRPIALDLFSGRGGWTDGLIAAGFRVIGFDIKEYEGYKGEFVKRDILDVTPEEIRSYKPRFICCSSPCEEFSVHGMKMFHPNPKHPELGIKLFRHAWFICDSKWSSVHHGECESGAAVYRAGCKSLWAVLFMGKRSAGNYPARGL
jgi:hypothetical protein